MRASTAPATSRVGPRGGGELVRRPVVTAAAGDGRPLATLFAEAVPAAWLPPGAGWWPRPRRVAAAGANARWDVALCHGCGMHRAVLVATRALDVGEEVCTEANPSPEVEDANWPYEATFDGGARQVGQTWAAGAGATLWAHHLAGGPPTCIARATVALPWDATAQVAEAIGCRTALALLAELRPYARAARVVGDNTAVVRYCAGTARLRRPQLQAHLEVGLGAVLAAGWRLSWQAVRRRLNGDADALATAGVYWAAQLRGRGVTDTRVQVEWLPGAEEHQA